MTMLRYLTRLTALALIVTLMGLVAIVQAQDEVFEPILLENGDVIEAEFDVDSNAHLYSFFGSEDDTVTISMTQPETGLIDPYLVLIDGNGQVIARDDDGGDVLLSALISDVTLPGDGIYFVLATELLGLRFDADDSGLAEQVAASDTADLSYTLTIAGISMPSDEQDVTTSARLVEQGEAVQLSLSAETPVAFVLFAGDAGDVVTVSTADTADPVDTILYLFDPTGLRIAANDDGADTPQLLSQIDDVELPEDGIYMVVVTAYAYETTAEFDDWDGGGTVVLTIE